MSADGNVESTAPIVSSLMPEIKSPTFALLALLLGAVGGGGGATALVGLSENEVRDIVRDAVAAQFEHQRQIEQLESQLHEKELEEITRRLERLENN